MLECKENVRFVTGVPARVLSSPSGIHEILAANHSIDTQTQQMWVE